jgi:hypothetical protein
VFTLKTQFGEKMNRMMSFILIGLFLAGCEAPLQEPNLFKNPVCEPPCWENITPGGTSKSDALAILSKIDAVDQPIIDKNQPFLRFDDEIDFHFYKDLSSLGFMDILKDRVSMIGFGPKLEIRLQDAVRLFGPPQSVLVVHAGEIYAVTFLNPQDGIAYGYNFNDRATEIKPGDEISVVDFFDPKQYQLFLNYGIFSYFQMSAEETSNRLQPWKGYGSIDQYSTPVYP